MRELMTCDHCGEALPPEFLTAWEGRQLCKDCLEVESLHCSCCEARFPEDANAGTHSTPLCRACYDRDYTTCSRCGRLLSLDEADYLSCHDTEPLCEDCYDDALPKSAIHDYTTSRSPSSTARALATSGWSWRLTRGVSAPM